MTGDEIAAHYENFVLQNFDLAECMEFMKKHCVEIVRLPDWQYACYIDGVCIDVDVDFFATMINGIKKIKQNENNS